MINYELATVDSNGVAYFAERGTAKSLHDAIEHYIDSSIKNWPCTFRKVSWNRMLNCNNGNVIRVIGHEYTQEPDMLG